jgi:Lrp/AsnC family leucine-responsive transcriptional regulator
MALRTDTRLHVNGSRPAAPMAPVALDDIDRKILTLLQADARLTNAAIGERVGLSAPSVFERVKKLERKGVIEGYTVRVNHAAIGQGLTAFVRLTTRYDEKHDPGMAAIAAEPGVFETHTVAGEDCLLVKVKVADTDELAHVLHRIKNLVTVERSVTMIALTTHKE